MHIGQATAPALYAKLPFDPVNRPDRSGDRCAGEFLVARPNFPARDLKELVSYVRAQGDKITYGDWSGLRLAFCAG